MASKERLREEYYELRRNHGFVIAKREGFSLQGALARGLEAEKGEQGKEIDGRRWIERVTSLYVEEGPDTISLNPMIEKFAGEIEIQAQRLKPEFHEIIFAGEFVTGDFNACARQMKNGILILINAGTMSLIHQVATLLGYFVKFNESDTDLLDPHRVIAILADTAIAYFVRKDSHAAERVPALYGFKGNLVAGIRRECERFVLAHEYGHAIAGHLREDEQVSMSNTVLLAKNWEKEFEADRLGMQLLLSEDDDYAPNRERISAFYSRENRWSVSIFLAR